MIQQFHFWIYIEKNWKQALKRFLHTHVHNNQKVKAQMSTNKWMNKENVVYTGNGILVSLKNRTPVTCYHMDKPWRCYVEWNKSVTKGQILYAFTYMRYLEQSTLWEQKIEWWLRGIGEGEMESWCSVDIEFRFCTLKSSRDLLHSNVNTVNMIVHLKMVMRVKLYVFITIVKNNKTLKRCKTYTLKTIKHHWKKLMKTYPMVTTHLPVQETREMWVQSLGWEDPLEEGTATHSSILAWRISWTEEPGRLHVHRIAKRQTWLNLARMYSMVTNWKT